MKNTSIADETYLYVIDVELLETQSNSPGRGGLAISVKVVRPF